MGAGSSSKVKNIHLEPEENEELVYEKDYEGNTAISARSKEELSAVVGKSGTTVDDTDVDALTAQLCESESQRLDLEDRVQCLEEQLAKFQAQSIEAEEKTCDETLHAKDQYITKLEKEKTDVEEQYKKMKSKLTRKVKQLKTEMTEYKQEVNFQIMELKDEIRHAKADNKEKQGKSASNDPALMFPEIAETPLRPPGGEKMKLILDLSEQVTDQEDKIDALGEKLQEKNQIIEELRRQLKNSATTHSSRVASNEKSSKNSKQSDGANTGAGSRNTGAGSRNTGAGSSASPSKPAYPNKHVTLTNTAAKLSGSASSNLSSQNRSNSNQTKTILESAGIENTVDILCTLDEEYEQECKNMAKLSSLLQGSKVPKSQSKVSAFSVSSDSLDDDVVDNRKNVIDVRPVGSTCEVDIVENIRRISLVDELIEHESGTGRDSGLGSAGKREEEPVNVTKDKVVPSGNGLPDWEDSGSGLSDSDFDRDTGFDNMSKISSAPPKMRGDSDKVRKLKKKSSSLKKRVSVNDRPPRPGKAFVEETDQYSSPILEESGRQFKNF